MVEPMKKLSVLALASSRREFLDRLQGLGVMHLTNQTLNPSAEVEELDEKLKNLKKTLQFLANHKTPPPPTEVKTYSNVDEFCQAAADSLQKLIHLHTEKENLNKDIKSLLPWGDFDPQLLEVLEGQGLRFSFLTHSKRKYDPEAFKDHCVYFLSEEGNVVHLLLITREGEEPVELEGLIPQDISRKNLEHLQTQQRNLNQAIKEEEVFLSGLYSQRKMLELYIEKLEEKRDYLVADLSLNKEAGGEMLSLVGYVPQADLASVQLFLEKQDVLYLVDDPSDPQEVPIRLKNFGPFRYFEPITRIFGLPNYGEFDTTAFLAPFFALFFGLCLADFGYGLLVLGLSLTAFFVVKKPPGKFIASLGIMLGFMTLLGGLLFNTAFGIKILDIPGLPDALRSFVVFDDLDAAMAFALTLGIVQLFVGYGLQIANRIRQRGFVGGLQPLGTLLLILGTLFLALKNLGPDYKVGPIPVGFLVYLTVNPARVGLYLLVLGGALVLFFNNLNKKIWIRPLLGLWEMYGIVSGVPGDVLSYIRIFALSLAGGLLGGAVNQIAFMVRGDNPNFIAYIFMLLILLGGHGINFALASLGAFVHPLRLTFVEFYKAVGFTGGGKAYRPFMKRNVLDGGMG